MIADGKRVAHLIFDVTFVSYIYNEISELVHLPKATQRFVFHFDSLRFLEDQWSFGARALGRR